MEGTYGQLYIDKATGAFTYTLGADLDQNDPVHAAQAAAVLALGVEQAQEIFSYTAYDGQYGTDGSLTITVTGVNDAPVATPVTLAGGTENNVYIIDAAALLAGVTDPDSLSLSITDVTIESGGGSIVSNDDGTWSYSPDLNYVGPVSFNYTAFDGSLSSSSSASLTLGLEYAVAPILSVGTVPTDGAALMTALSLQAGDIISLEWNFATDDYLPFNDFAFATVNGAAFLLSDIQLTGSFGSTGWHTFHYTVPTDGTYTIGAGVMNEQDMATMSYLAVDNIRVNGAVVQSFENGLAGSSSTGTVSVVMSAQSSVIPTLITPTDGAWEALLTSNPVSESEIESFLGLAAGQLLDVVKSEGPEHTPIIIPISVSVPSGAHPDDTYVTVSGAPAGSEFNHGVYDATHDTWRIEATDLVGDLTLTTPTGYVGSFTLTVTATSVVIGSDIIRDLTTSDPSRNSQSARNYQRHPGSGSAAGNEPAGCDFWPCRQRHHQGVPRRRPH